MTRGDVVARLRFTDEELQLIDRARARFGQSRRAFILSACIPEAERIIVEQATRPRAEIVEFRGRE